LHSSTIQITIFDNRGCTQHVNKEYRGPKAGGPDDEMTVKVSNEKIPYPTDEVVEEVRSFCLSRSSLIFFTCTSVLSTV
jgi:hypothetical protein